MLADVLVTGGLGLDLVGAVLIFRFAFAPKVHRGGSGALLLEGPSWEEALRVVRYGRLSRGGILLLALGFALQIGGVWA